MSKKSILIITDGIGHNESCEYNAFCKANKPTYDRLFKEYPNSLIKTYGLSVGLPEGQMGNSEVGHMTLGTGRVLYQDLVKISLAVDENKIKDNRVFNSTIKNSKNLHLIGLMSDGGVHSHISHILELAKVAASRDKKVYLHLITDGRDVYQKSAMTYLEQVNSIVNENIKIASIGGRFYGMDRDNRWDRVKSAFDSIYNGDKKSSLNPKEYIEESYNNDITDEFIKPASFGDYSGFKNSDSVIFCNFRSDRARELSRAIAQKDFNEFEKNSLDLNVATMTQYDKNFVLPILFEKDIPKNTLSEIISQNGLKQLHIAETEKYAHVTFFFNGGLEEPYKNEDRVLIPSPKVSTYDLQPQMSAKDVGNGVKNAIKEKYDFIVVNFANGDMVGHTGDLNAAIKAVECVDSEIGEILELAKENDYNLLITSDHGNCEKMMDESGKVLTNHTVGDVFCFVISNKVDKINNGGLNNIAPTILKLMEITPPKEMDEALF